MIDVSNRARLARGLRTHRLASDPPKHAMADGGCPHPPLCYSRNPTRTIYDYVSCVVGGRPCGGGSGGGSPGATRWTYHGVRVSDDRKTSTTHKHETRNMQARPATVHRTESYCTLTIVTHAPITGTNIPTGQVLAATHHDYGCTELNTAGSDSGALGLTSGATDRARAIEVTDCSSLSNR